LKPNGSFGTAGDRRLMFIRLTTNVSAAEVPTVPRIKQALVSFRDRPVELKAMRFQAEIQLKVSITGEQTDARLYRIRNTEHVCMYVNNVCVVNLLTSVRKTFGRSASFIKPRDIDNQSSERFDSHREICNDQGPRFTAARNRKFLGMFFYF
jgi:hypothetical protein